MRPEISFCFLTLFLDMVLAVIMTVRRRNILCAFEHEVVGDCFLRHTINGVASLGILWSKIDLNLASIVEVEAIVGCGPGLSLFEFAKFEFSRGVVVGIGDERQTTTNVKWALPVLFLEDLLVLSSVVGNILGCYPRRMTHGRTETVEMPRRLAVVAKYHWAIVGVAGQLTLVAERHGGRILDKFAGIDDIWNCRIANFAAKIISRRRNRHIK